VVSAHFAGFTYMRPFLERVPRLDVAELSLALLAFGIGGFVGNIVGGALSERSGSLAVGVASLLIGVAAAALFVAGTSTMLAYAATATWGFAFGAFPVSISAWNTKAAADHAESAGALLLVAFQIAIAAGAVLGGILVDAAGPSAVIAYAALAAAVGTALILSFAHRVR
jgi:predicted MFS family arabinose efflux permease